MAQACRSAFAISIRARLTGSPLPCARASTRGMRWPASFASAPAGSTPSAARACLRRRRRCRRSRSASGSSFRPPATCRILVRLVPAVARREPTFPTPRSWPARWQDLGPSHPHRRDLVGDADDRRRSCWWRMPWRRIIRLGARRRASRRPGPLLDSARSATGRPRRRSGFGSAAWQLRAREPINLTHLSPSLLHLPIRFRPSPAWPEWR